MGRIRVVRNDFRKVADALDQKIAEGVDNFSTTLEDALKAGVWKRTGVIASTIRDFDAEAPFHATVGVGVHKGRGFYSRFQEWGTVKQAARPVVGPIAHLHEPAFAQQIADAIREACRV